MSFNLGQLYHDEVSSHYWILNVYPTLIMSASAIINNKVKFGGFMN